MGIYFQIEEYHQPQLLSQAVELLSECSSRARIIAGGTDLLPTRPGVKQLDVPNRLVDISKLGLDYLKTEGDETLIGATTTINALGASRLFSSAPYQALADAAKSHSTTTIRNRATIGGNLCNASPCADLALPLLVLNATIIAKGATAERQIPIENFFKGPNLTALDNEEVLFELRIPAISGSSGSSFLKRRRFQTAIDMAVVNVATALTCINGRCEAAAIALGSVGPIPFRAKNAEAVLAGVELNEENLKKAAATAAEEASPIDDIRASSDYRRKMVAVLVRRSLQKSMQRCGQ